MGQEEWFHLPNRISEWQNSHGKKITKASEEHKLRTILELSIKWVRVGGPGTAWQEDSSLTFKLQEKAEGPQNPTP